MCKNTPPSPDTHTHTDTHTDKQTEGQKGQAFALYSPQELSSNRPHLQDAGCQPLSLTHGRGLHQLLLLDEATGHPGGHGALLGWDDDSDSRVATPTHGPTAGVHHEADEEAVKHNGHLG